MPRLSTVPTSAFIFKPRFLSVLLREQISPVEKDTVTLEEGPH